MSLMEAVVSSPFSSAACERMKWNQTQPVNLSWLRFVLLSGRWLEEWNAFQLYTMKKKKKTPVDIWRRDVSLVFPSFQIPGLLWKTAHLTHLRSLIFTRPLYRLLRHQIDICPGSAPSKHRNLRLSVFSITAPLLESKQRRMSPSV